MRSTDVPLRSGNSILEWILYILLGSTTLVITVNSFDSGLAKPPLLVLWGSLLVAVYVAQVLWVGKLEFRRSPTDIPVLVFLLLIAVSVLYSTYQWNSLQAIACWIPFIICFYAGTQLFSRFEHVGKLAWVLAVIASIVCLVGVVQFFFADKLALDFFIGEDRRISSTLTNATYLSGYVVLLFPLLLAFALVESKSKWKQRYLIVLLCGLGFMLITTSTRSSVAGFILSLIVFGLMSQQFQRKTILRIIATGLVVGTTIFVSPRLVQRIESSFETGPSSSFARRMYFWKGGYEAFKSAPFFGHGIGSFGEVILEHRSPEYWVVKSEDLVPHAHNELIETAVDLGSVGVVAYLTICGTAFVAGLRRWPNHHRRDRLLRVGIFCSLLAILIDNLANVSLRVAPVGATTWLLMGVLASGPNTHVRITEFRPKKWFVLIPLGGWALFAIWFGRLQWDMYNADGHVIKGFVAGISNQLNEGAREYEQAVLLDPHNFLARSNLTLILLRMGRHEEALQSAKQLQILSPRYPKVNLMQAAALVSLGRYPEALASIDKELVLRNHPDAYYYQALAYGGLGDSVREASALKNLLLASLKGRIRYQFAVVSRRLQQLVQAEEDMRKYREVYVQLNSMFPSDTTIASALAGIDLKLARLHQGSNLAPH